MPIVASEIYVAKREIALVACNFPFSHIVFKKSSAVPEFVNKKAILHVGTMC